MAIPIKLPYVTTRPETDLTVTLLLAPLWWISGFSVFIYPLAAMIVFLKLFLPSALLNHSLRIPKITKWLALFLIFYLLSVLLNLGRHPAQRIFASLNNYSLAIMGLSIIVVVYNIPALVFLKEFLKTCRWLCLVTGIIGVVFLALWFGGHRDFEIPALLGQWVPAFFNYPYFYVLLGITPTMSDWFANNSEVPRLTLYSQVPTGTGGFMMMIIPMMMAYYALTKKKGFEYGIVGMLSLTVLFFSLSRSAICGFISALVFVNMLEKKGKIFFASLLFLIVLFLTGYLYKWGEWILNVRFTSTAVRMGLYEEALKVVLEENLLMGIGVRLRDDFSLATIGSHSFYIELLLVTGIIGISLFILFQILVVRAWYDQKKLLRNRPEKVLWKYLGISLIGLDIWLFTDSLLALPFIPYAYFLVTAGIFALDRILRSEPLRGELFPVGSKVKRDLSYCSAG